MGRPRKYVDPAEVVRLRQTGLSWPAIARKMHLGQGTVFRAHRAAVNALQLSKTQPRLTPKRTTTIVELTMSANRI